MVYYGVHGSRDASADLAVWLPVPDLPSQCPECHSDVYAWPISTFGNRLGIECPACHVVIANVLAVPPDRE